MEEGVEVAKQLMTGLLERMEIETTVEGFLKEGDVYLEVRTNREGVLIGRHGRTLESLQFLIHRMVNKRLKEPVRVIVDINDYRKKREESLKRMAIRFGEKVKMKGQSLTVGPFNAQERRIIHITLKEDPLLITESIGEGEMKRMKIIPAKREAGRV
ncbi:MAG: KH domain-containing protein [Syntrophaceae bacterium]|nr:KH domain-containing protein [Syntrophaceae bacterium]